jgi:hypothetical protein
MESSLSGDGTFSFDEVRDGEYYISIIPSSDESPYYSTFYGDANFWEDAEPVFISASRTDLDITLVSKPSANALNGNGIIHGRIIESTNGRMEVVNGLLLDGTPVEDVSVFLVSLPSEEVIAEVKTDENGDFQIVGIPEGEYALKVEVVGLSMDLANSTITISSDQQEVVVTAMITDEGITLETEKVLGIISEFQLTVYPNPTSEILTIVTDVAGSFDWQIVTLGGVEIRKGKFSNTSTVINTEEIPEGLYLLMVKSKNDEIRIFRILKMSIP